MATFREYLKEAIIYEAISMDDIKIGDYVSRRVKESGGLTHGTQGYVVDKKGGQLIKLVDQWGGGADRWHEIKGMKISKPKSKKVTSFKPIMDVIKKLGNEVGK